MTRDDIIRMAREVGFKVDWQHADVAEIKAQRYERFAALVAAAEREACALICDAVQQKSEDNGAWMWEAKNCATAIRARGETK